MSIGDVNVAQSDVISRPLVVENQWLPLPRMIKSTANITTQPLPTATGFVNGEDENNLTTPPTLTPLDDSLNVIPDNSNTAGTFSIVPTGAVAMNYSFEYVNGVFIDAVRCDDYMGSKFELSCVCDNIALNATASSNLPVTFDIARIVAKLLVTRAINLQAWWRLTRIMVPQVMKLPVMMVSFILLTGPTWTTGKFRNGSSFDGTNDYAAAFGYKGITGGDKRTYSFWLKSGTAGRGVMYSGLASGSGSFALTLDGSGKLKVDYGNGSVLGTTNLADNAWHQVVVTLPNAGTVGDTKIYVDGSNDTGTITSGRYSCHGNYIQCNLG